MGMNLDETATCDNCGNKLPGFGILYGMICTRIKPPDGELEQLFFCYGGGCADKVLSGHLNH